MTTPMNDSTALGLLGLRIDVGQLDSKLLKAAYRTSARSSHPDAPGGDEERFKQVAEAAEYLQKRLSGEIPAVTREPIWADNAREPVSRRRPVWRSKVSAADAADALRFDDILDDLRTVIEVRPLVEFLPGGEVMVSQLPAGAMVSFDGKAGARVFDRDGNELECVRSTVGDPRDGDLGDYVRGQ